MKWLYLSITMFILISCSSSRYVVKNNKLVDDIDDIISGSLVNKLQKSDWNSYGHYELKVYNSELIKLKKLLKKKEDKQLYSYLLLKNLIHNLEFIQTESNNLNEIDFSDQKIIAEFKFK